MTTTSAGILESGPFSESELALALRVLEPPPACRAPRPRLHRGRDGRDAQGFRSLLEESGLERGTVIKITSEVFDTVGKEGARSGYWSSWRTSPKMADSQSSCIR